MDSPPAYIGLAFAFGESHKTQSYPSKTVEILGVFINSECLFVLMDPRITLVTLGVTGIDESIRFYRDGLGFPLQDRQEDSDVAFFTLDGTWLSIYPRELLAEDATISDDGTGFSGVTLAHNVSTEAEVDTILKEAEAAGGRIVKPAQEVFWGGYSGYFADPDDHLWEVAYPDLTEW